MYDELIWSQLNKLEDENFEFDFKGIKILYQNWTHLKPRILRLCQLLLNNSTVHIRTFLKSFKYLRRIFQEKKKACRKLTRVYYSEKLGSEQPFYKKKSRRKVQRILECLQSHNKVYLLELKCLNIIITCSIHKCSDCCHVKLWKIFLKRKVPLVVLTSIVKSIITPNGCLKIYIYIYIL